MAGKITVAGLGPGGLDLLPLGTYRRLQAGLRVLLRTKKHPAAEELMAQGLVWGSFDYLYEEKEDFREVYQGIVDKLLSLAAEGKEEIIYGVPGHPLILETSVSLLLEQAPQKGVEVEILPAMSFLDAILLSLKGDAPQEVLLLDGLELDRSLLQMGKGMFIAQVYNRRIASEVKLTLMDFYPDDYTITIIRAAGVPGREKVVRLPLYQLDRLDWLDHLTTVYLPPRTEKSGVSSYPLDDLVQVMATLRSGEGCPWDREQTHESLKRYLIEETYEVLEAIELKDMHKLCEELGDLLLQIVFHGQIAAENGYFDLNDVIRLIVEKMIRRHPHVFADVKVDSAEEVLCNWEEIKAEEKRSHGDFSSLMDVPRGLPALLRAEKVQARASRVGFDWPEVNGAWEKAMEELEELRQVMAEGGREEVKEEYGDLLFALVNVSRFLQIDPEDSLSASVDKFIQRFRYLEKYAAKTGKPLQSMSLEEMDRIWEKAM
ncbi:MAG: nucleoside triphosphate pyrophosphohydrolase, partial [Clostridia bacterium]|nr:nucleoside triphosphate pyrophosphohydrolase [Clostridia bacterium]